MNTIESDFLKTVNKHIKVVGDDITVNHVSLATELAGKMQTCPKCYGQGVVWFPTEIPMNETFTGDGKPYECDVCKGEKIIDSLTGKPPKK